MSPNPYALSRTENEFDLPTTPVIQHAYTAPPEGNAPYGSPGNPFASKLAYEHDSTPDPRRTQREPNEDNTRVNPTTPKSWWRRILGDSYRRHSVESQTGIITQSTRAPHKVAPRPLGIDTVTRPLAETSPNTYSFTRPMTGEIPSRLNGIHFSMADHKRARYNGDIYGMNVPHRPRATYRLDPPAQGEDVIDKAAYIVMADDTQLSVTNIPSGNRSYRLG